MKTNETVKFDPRKYGNKIRAMIKSKRISQEKFAEMVDISCSMLAQILSGKRTPSQKTHAKILYMLDYQGPDFILECCDRIKIDHE